MRAFAFIALTAIVLCADVHSAIADSIGIEILSAEYSTAVSTSFVRFDDDTSTRLTTSRTVTGANPITDTLQSDTRIVASAAANTFSVMASTEAFSSVFGQVHAGATATTSVQFMPVQNGTTTIGFDFIGTGHAWFSNGLVKLVDVTNSSALLWSYSWVCCEFSGNVPFTSFADGDAELHFEQMFLASHLYELTMEVSTNANLDTQSMTITASGLHKVPEPMTLLLVGVGLAGLAWRSRQQSRSPAS